MRKITGKLFAFVIISLIELVSSKSDKPNFIFIFADDVGYGDLASYGHPYCKTPNLDRLADEGTSFHKFYMTGNICPTSRAGLMTSRNPSWFPNNSAEYGFLGTKTITEYLHDGGYTVGHIGKWNIGPRPDEDDRRFREYGIDYLRITGSIKDDPRGREGLRFDKTIEFLEEQNDEEQPFYLNLWIYATHSPIEPTKDLLEPFDDLKVDRDDFEYHMQKKFDDIERYRGDIDESMKYYCAELYGMDIQIGRILDKLDELDMTDNTIVVFSSDNGPEDVEGRDEVYQSGYAGGLRAGKHSWYEGGPRVPFIVRWPGNVPAGKVNKDSIMFGLDWLPTICSIADVPIQSNTIEGEDVSDIWFGSNRSRKNPILYRNLQEQDQVTMIANKWKLLEWENELYNLDKDPTERNNVYRDNPKVVNAMKDMIEIWEYTLPTVHARLPRKPYKFDPDEPAIIIPQPYIDNEIPECFSGVNTVNVLGKGVIPISELNIGDYVLSDDESNRSFTRVYSFGHKDYNYEAIFIQIFTSDIDEPLEISSAHILYVNDRPIPAQDVRIGDMLSGRKQVIKISHVQRRGVYAPVTESGKIVVSGITASSYVALLNIHPSLLIFGTHMCLSPIRVVCAVNFDYCKQETYSNGFSDNYLTLIQLTGYLSKFNRFVQVVAVVVVTMLMVWFYAVEMVLISPVLIIGGFIVLFFCLRLIFSRYFIKSIFMRKRLKKHYKNY